MKGGSFAARDYRVWAPPGTPGRFVAKAPDGAAKSVKIIELPASVSTFEGDPAREHELQALALVNTVGVLPIDASFPLDADEHGRKLVAIISPFAAAGDAGDYLTETQAERTIEESMSLALHIISGLAGLHRLGVVHGDIKPKNVIFWDSRTEGGGLRPYITDFGSAQQVGAGELRAATIAYASPELVAGKQASQASDVWALGVTLLEVFRCEVWASRRNADEAPLSAASARDVIVKSTLPEYLSDALKGCFREDSESRITAAALLQELSQNVAIVIDDDRDCGVGAGPNAKVFLQDNDLRVVLGLEGWPSFGEFTVVSMEDPKFLQAWRAAAEFFATSSIGGYVRAADTLEAFFEEYRLGAEKDARQVIEGGVIRAPAADMTLSPELLSQLLDLQCRALVNVLEDGLHTRLQLQLKQAAETWTMLDPPMTYWQKATLLQAAIYSDSRHLARMDQIDWMFDSEQSEQDQERTMHVLVHAGLYQNDQQAVRDGLAVLNGKYRNQGRFPEAAMATGLGMEVAALYDDEDLFYEVAANFGRAFSHERLNMLRQLDLGMLAMDLHPNGRNPADDPHTAETLKDSGFHQSIKRPGTIYLALRGMRRMGLHHQADGWTGYHLRRPIFTVPTWEPFRQAIMKLDGLRG